MNVAPIVGGLLQRQPLNPPTEAAAGSTGNSGGSSRNVTPGVEPIKETGRFVTSPELQVINGQQLMQMVTQWKSV